MRCFSMSLITMPYALSGSTLWSIVYPRTNAMGCVISICWCCGLPRTLESSPEYAAELPNAFRFMTRGLGTQETRSNDLLSLLMFQPDYLQRMLDLGYADAKAREDEIAAFLAK